MDEGGVDEMSLRFVLSWVLAPLLVIGAVLTGGYWVSAGAGDTRSSLTSALDTLPADTVVAGFTDWSAIRDRFDLGAASTAAGRAALNDDVSLRDLSTRSVIGRAVEEMHQSYGWSAADADWEVFGQAGDGAVMVARLGDSVSMSAVSDALNELGYVKDGRVWNSPASGGLSTTFAAVAVIPDKRLVVAADRSTYVTTVLQVVDRKERSLLSVRPAVEVASALEGADSALLQTGRAACGATTLRNLADDVKAQAAAAISRSGALADTTFAGRGLTDISTGNQELRFSWSFASGAEAAEQLRVRTALASGPFIGGSGRVEDALQLTSSRVDGATATLRFDHDPVRGAFMGAQTPLLFASCPE